MFRNVELKAIDHDRAATLERCRNAGAVDRELLHHRDTYFSVSAGRLKLRQALPGLTPAVLVAYERADEPEARLSAYHLVDVPDPAALLEALGGTLGVLRVVEKQRRLLLWEETVRIHLDTVDGLGDFVEIEAVADEGSDLSREHDQAERLQELLAIERGDIVSASYLELADL